MPLPFILGAAAVVAGAAGVKKGLDARDTNKKAKRIIDNAKELISKTENDRKKAVNLCEESLEKLGKIRLNSMKNLHCFITAFNKIRYKYRTNNNFNKDIYISSEKLEEIKLMGQFSLNISAGIAQGSITGSLAALGAYGGTMTFATASTGTAIASLSGAAATNATLAALGGGSLAAGGLGMMGGTAVLGGLVAGPALAIAGFTMNSKAKANLDKAETIYDEVETACNAVRGDIDDCNNITKHSNLYIKTTVSLDGMLSIWTRQLENILYYSGMDAEYYSKEEREIVAKACKLAECVAAIVKVKIIDKNNKLNDQAKKELSSYQNKVIEFR